MKISRTSLALLLFAAACGEAPNTGGLTEDDAGATTGEADAGSVADGGSVADAGAEVDAGSAGTLDGGAGREGDTCFEEAECASLRCILGICAPPREVTFDQVYQEVLVAQNCTNGYCHGSGAGGLMMSDADTAWRALLSPATIMDCGPMQRVTPGRPNSSMVILKIDPVFFSCGSKMPPNTAGLSEELSQLVRDWIAAGARR